MVFLGSKRTAAAVASAPSSASAASTTTTATATTRLHKLKRTTTTTLLLFITTIITVLATTTTTTATGDSGGGIQGAMQLGSTDFNMSWVIMGSTTTTSSTTDPTAGGTIEITLTWTGDYDWAAIGLHPHPALGMKNAEVFMCAPASSNTPGGVFCQVRNTLGGYVVPALDKQQYIKLVRGTSSGTGSTSLRSATFSRSVGWVASSPLSFNVSNSAPNGLIYARGKWGGGGGGSSMPAGTPLPHGSGDASMTQVNFFKPPAPPPPPPPSPPSPPGPPGPGPPSPCPPLPPPPPPFPPGKQPGVWPQRWHSNMTVAPFFDPLTSNSLDTTMQGTFYYDFPGRRQLWQYYNVRTGAVIGGELWVDDLLYSYGLQGDCNTVNMTFSIITPDWLNHTDYTTTNWVLLQPAQLEKLGTYARADLYKKNNGIAMTNEWILVNSTRAQPVRMEGPFVFNDLSERLLMEFIDFYERPEGFPDALFTVPSWCKPPLAAREGDSSNRNRSSSSSSSSRIPLASEYKGKTPAALFHALRRQQLDAIASASNGLAHDEL